MVSNYECVVNDQLDMQTGFMTLGSVEVDNYTHSSGSSWFELKLVDAAGKELRHE